MGCREWFLEYARKWYGANPKGEAIRAMLPGMRVDSEVRNAVQRYQDEVWKRQWEELEYGED